MDGLLLDTLLNLFRIPWNKQYFIAQNVTGARKNLYNRIPSCSAGGIHLLLLKLETLNSWSDLTFKPEDMKKYREAPVLELNVKVNIQISGQFKLPVWSICACHPPPFGLCLLVYKTPVSVLNSAEG